MDARELFEGDRTLQTNLESKLNALLGGIAIDSGRTGPSAHLFDQMTEYAGRPGKRVRPREVRAAIGAHVEIRAGTQFEQNALHPLLQSAAGVLRCELAVLEIQLQRYPEGKLVS